MRRPRLGKAQAIGLVVFLTIGFAALAWYATSRASSASQHFESCRTTADGRVALRYTYGVGDEVTASFVSRGTPIVVSLRIDRADGPQPAIALHGEMRFQSFAGADERVEHEDGTVIHCTQSRTL